MSAPALLLDEMLSAAIAVQLRARELDVVAVVEATTLVSMPDEDLLGHATEQQRVLVTANIADFAAIAKQWRGSGRTHHGILYVAHRSFPQDRSFVGAIVDAITGMRTANTLPSPGAEAFLRRVS